MDYSCAMGYFSIPLAKMQKKSYKISLLILIKLPKLGKDYQPVELQDKMDFIPVFPRLQELPGNPAHL